MKISKIFISALVSGVSLSALADVGVDAYTKYNDKEFGRLVLMLSRVSQGLEVADPASVTAAQRFIQNVDRIGEAKFRVVSEVEGQGNYERVTEYVIQGRYLGGGDVISCPTETRVLETFTSKPDPSYREQYMVVFTRKNRSYDCPEDWSAK